MTEEDQDMPDPSPVAPAPMDEEPSTTGVVADDDAAEVDEVDEVDDEG